MILLSICIATLKARRNLRAPLISLLNKQRSELPDPGIVEIVEAEDEGQMVIGQKRNLLYSQAKGKYVCSIDDDDWIADYYVREILKAIETDPDAVSINGSMTTNGRDLATWDISLFNPYITTRKAGRTHYLRFTNHLSPIKREIVLKYPFPEIQFAEDYAFARQLHDANAIKTEVRIPLPMYIYRYSSRK